MEDLEIASRLVDELSDDQIRTLMQYEQSGADGGSIDYKKSLKPRLAIRMAPRSRFVEVVAFLAVIAGVIVTHTRHGGDLNLQLKNEASNFPDIDENVREAMLAVADRIAPTTTKPPQ